MDTVLGARCVLCGKTAPAKADTTLCPACGGMLDIVYDYALIKSRVNKRVMAQRRERSMWRYREFLPIRADSGTEGLRVGASPLYAAKRLGRALGLARLYVKDDGLNPTASLKDRASALAVVKAIEAGAGTVACASTGNAASSLAGSAAARGLCAYIFVPRRAPAGKLAQLLVFGANVISVQGSYEDAFRLSAQAINRWGWYNRNAAVNPYLAEGKKTVAFEIAEQLGWKAPDYVAVSVGDGCTLAGVWKGFTDLYEAGFIASLPRLISVQAEGCRPINNAVSAGTERLVPMEENTLADSIAVGVPRNFHKAVRAVRSSGGICVNVSDQEILAAMAQLGALAGVFAEPAGAAGTAGLIKAAKQGLIPQNASVVSIVTGSGLKDIAGAQKAAGGPIEALPDMQSLLEAFARRGGPQ